MKAKIWLSSPHMSGNERHFINDAFSTNWIAPLGPNVSGFENDLQEYLKEDTHVAALSSGTAAIHLALVLLNVQHGDEVLCQSMTFAASANPIVYQGAVPIFIDSERDTWNMCPEQLERAIKDRIHKGKKPKAIIAVHLYGMPYKADEIHSIAQQHDIPVIEDSAEALGSSFHNRKCGTFGDLAVLSFNGNKIITTSGGGALVTKSEDLKHRAVFLSTQAKEDDPAYVHNTIGYNYRMSNILAGIGRGQMKVLDDYVVKRRANYNYYKSELKGLDQIEFIDEPAGYFSNRWLSCVLTESIQMREDLRKSFAEENIECRPLWKPMHQQPVFKDTPQYLNGVSDDLFEKGLCLPSGSNLTHNELGRVLDCFKTYFVQC